MEVGVSPGDQVNTYCTTEGLRALAALFDACARDGGVVIAGRHGPDGADLVIFRGTETPLTFPAYRRLRGALQGTRATLYALPEARPETPADRADEEWRQKHQITVRTQDRVVLFGGTGYGLRLCALACIDLATLDQPGFTDHYHWDEWWLGTSKTVEFILRNIDRA